LNDVQGARETFAGFRFQEVKATYSVGVKGGLMSQGDMTIATGIQAFISRLLIGLPRLSCPALV
jgi:hypothetical protein